MATLYHTLQSPSSAHYGASDLQPIATTGPSPHFDYLVPSQNLSHTNATADGFSAPSSPTSETGSESQGGNTSPSSSLRVPSTRSRAGDRVPRPRNAFMIYRSEFWAGEKISRTIERDHRHISRIIGHCWNQMPEEEKDLWRAKAEVEKLEHRQKYPGYRFNPGLRAKKPIKRNVKRNGTEELLRCKQVAELILAGKEGNELETAVLNMEPLPAEATPTRTPKKQSKKPRAVSVATPNTCPFLPSPAHLTLEIPHTTCDIPVFRSPLLPPKEMQENIPPFPLQSIDHTEFFMDPTQTKPILDFLDFSFDTSTSSYSPLPLRSPASPQIPLQNQVYFHIPVTSVSPFTEYLCHPPLQGYSDIPLGESPYSTFVNNSVGNIASVSPPHLLANTSPKVDFGDPFSTPNPLFPILNVLTQKVSLDPLNWDMMQ